MQLSAYVVAAASFVVLVLEGLKRGSTHTEPTIEPIRGCVSAPGMYREMVVVWAYERPANARPRIEIAPETILRDLIKIVA